MTASITWDVTPAQWRGVLERSQQATFFHTPGWYQAHAEVSGYRPQPALLRFEDGAEAVLPLATRPAFRGLLTLAEAGIECGYGGLVATRPLDEAELKAAYRLVRSRFADLHVMGNPHAALESAMAGGEASMATTQLVPVLDADAQLKRMNPKRAARVRKAAKLGFELTVIPRPTGEDVARFYGMYAAHASYWQQRKWVRDEAYFRALFQHAGADLVLFLVHLDGQLAGFRLLGVHGEVAIGLHLATSAQHEKLDAGPFMIAETLNWCRENGVRVFDFLPSGALEGVKAYKASYGAEPVSFLSASTRSVWGHCLSAARAYRPRTALAESATAPAPQGA
jgi:CelD/BcsL family acetyltransferase involved in cellulose biosynthesis